MLILVMNGRSRQDVAWNILPNVTKYTDSYLESLLENDTGPDSIRRVKPKAAYDGLPVGDVGLSE